MEKVNSSHAVFRRVAWK